ncbi:hypothetical protein Ddye_030836 [Dipteronia dyeriana]|uniref:Uncharacterized protein n=1 Tax=Dipteronia dyeriana TaxID=168575 RepID=A0AAD9WLU2_9ROSI|nr:hypothetical protein Ddye_030836 [Dipteronia dyeriana]
MMLEFSDKSHPNNMVSRASRRFYFEDCWATKKDCQNIVSSVWGDNGCNNNQFDVLGKIASCGRKLDSWNNMKRKQHRQNISKCRKDLKEASKGERRKIGKT